MDKNSELVVITMGRPPSRSCEAAVRIVQRYRRGWPARSKELRGSQGLPKAEIQKV